MKRLLVPVLGLVATTAGAQSLVYSNAATVDCVTWAASPQEKRACIGTSANACMSATSDGSTTVGMGGCIDQELSYWDGILNANYKTLRAKTRRVDAGMKDMGASVTNLEQALRDMQREWISYRDATCDFERAQWGGGTGGGPATLSCLMRITGEQAMYLDETWIGE